MRKGLNKATSFNDKQIERISKRNPCHLGK